MKIFSSRAGDLWILAAIFAAALASLALPLIVSGGPGSSGHGLYAAIQTPGKGILIVVVDKLPEDADSHWDLDGAAGALRLEYAPDKGFRVVNASCPDRVCLRTGFISKAGQSIICAPNEVIISLGSYDKGEGDAIDAITR